MASGGAVLTEAGSELTLQRRNADEIDLDRFFDCVSRDEAIAVSFRTVNTGRLIPGQRM